jgi:hypothetical protein
MNCEVIVLPATYISTCPTQHHTNVLPALCKQTLRSKEIMLPWMKYPVISFLNNGWFSFFLVDERDLRTLKTKWGSLLFTPFSICFTWSLKSKNTEIPMYRLLQHWTKISNANYWKIITNNINIFSIPKYSTYFMPRHENLDCIPSASLQGVSTTDCSTSNWQRSCSQNIDYCKVIIVLPPKWSDWENLIRNFVRLGDIASASQSPHRLQIAGMPF